MFNLSGKNLINGQWHDSEVGSSSASLENVTFYYANKGQADEAVKAAKEASRIFATLSREKRADFLSDIALEIEALKDQIVAVAQLETGLPEARLIGEAGRTMGQLNLFAHLIKSTKYLDIRHDSALPDREPLPRPDLRLTHKAIGPVVIFGASNFPLAFSTAGGDTASALAAGCPVIFKAHEAHPGTCEIIAYAISQAINKHKLPSGIFQMLHSQGREVGQYLVKHPMVNAVGFTGSLSGGRALYDMCHSRPNPIPFYGELGSINPMFCLPKAMDERACEIAAGWSQSLTMGAGQFCTNPGVVMMLNNPAAQDFEKATVENIAQIKAQKMLSSGIYGAYCQGVEKLSHLCQKITSWEVSDSSDSALPAVFKVSAEQWMKKPEIQEEVFGPAGIMVLCDDIAQMQTVAEQLVGQLTATLHMNEEDSDLAKVLIPILEEKAGRLLANGFPTGVEVCDAMMHGGPYPASTDSRSTSVGTLAISRWLRPICYQNMPIDLLPNELQ